MKNIDVNNISKLINSLMSRKPIIDATFSLTQSARQRAADITPVITGVLREGWQSECNDSKGTIENRVEYAPFVNYGHKQGDDFVKGQFILERALTSLRDNELESTLEVALDALLGGG